MTMTTFRRKLANNPVYIALSHASYRLLTRLSPRACSLRRFQKTFGFPLREDAPVWWSEKLMLLKLRYYDRSPLVRRCANKYFVRDYAESCGLSALLIDLYGLWEDETKVPWDTLPDRCVLKSTMGCGMQMHVFCRERAALDVPRAKRTLHQALRDRYYLDYAEMQYAPGRDMRPQVLCERLLDTDNGAEAEDYKLFCFHGETRYVLYCFSRNKEGHAQYAFLDTDWTMHPELHPCLCETTPEKPACLPEMLAAARKLSAPFPFVRVDFYVEHGRPLLGEMTFTPSACVDAEITVRGQETLGALIDLHAADAAAMGIGASKRE